MLAHTGIHILTITHGQVYLYHILALIIIVFGIALVAGLSSK